MLFSTPLFVFLFLPAVLLVYYSIKDSGRNLFLLIASLLFYAWGEPVYILLMLASTAFNYVMGLLIGMYRGGRAGHALLGFGIVANLLLLIYYKYFSFFVDLISQLTGLDIHSAPIALPLGISFYTFHALSYIIDIHRGIVTPQKSVIDLGLYISFFPQLVAGPIIRYKDINADIESRQPTFEKFSSGVVRFCVGLSKKVLIANAMGEAADKVFALPYGEIGWLLAWSGCAFYTLQIYFDFSGYSDMAIGLGRMLGFSIKENFNLPYIAQSMRDFWRRWHISLSTWFRDYLYIPLGGSKGSALLTYRNLLIVFFVTGFWHGASWSFIIWGLFHGAFLALERGAWGKMLDSSPVWFRHVYTLMIVMIGWVLFRVAEFSDALSYLASMFGVHSGTLSDAFSFVDYWDIRVILAFVLGVFFSTDWFDRLSTRLEGHETIRPYFRLGVVGLVMLAFYLSLASIAAQTYNPFIYFRF